MKRVLLTGATGGLGRNAASALLARGVAVRATGRNRAAGAALAAEGAEFIALDLATASPLEVDALMGGVDAVWHCAALSSPWGATESFEGANVRATEYLLGAAGRMGVTRFVHISTPAIYFDYRDHLDVREDYRPATYVNAYAATKARAEELVHKAVGLFPGMRCVILRPRAIFGPHDQVLVPRLQRVLQERGGTLPLARGGRVTLDLTYVDNVVHAMWLASTTPALVSGDAFNITNHEPAYLADVLRELFERQLGLPFAIRSVPYPVLALAARCMEFFARRSGREPAMTAYSAGAISFDMTLDNARARTVLGYRPQVGLAEGLRRTAAWLRANG